MPPRGNKEGALTQKSPAEFFAENRNIAGFDSPGKSLYTTIRELVENSLDAAESISVLPDVEIVIEEITQEALNSLRGIQNVSRIDEEMFKDFETEADRKKREQREERERKRVEEVRAKKGDAAAAKEARRLADNRERQGRREYFRVTVRDNGAGMAHDDIPVMLGRVLSGTKYGVKQTRGKFGLGAKMALIWSKMSTGMPFEIRSARSTSGRVSRYRLDIDIHRNEPNVLSSSLDPNDASWRGSEVAVVIEGSWAKHRAKIVQYLRQIAVITPYAQFRLTFRGADGRGDLSLAFARRTDKMPRAPKETRHHPAAVDLETLRRIVAATEHRKLLTMLHKDFDCVSRDLAQRICLESQGGIDPGTDPRELTSEQIARLHQLLHEVRFPDPTGEHLSPAGEYNLRLGVMKELRPDMVATCAGSVGAHEGHAFLVEAAVSLGGRDVRPGLNVFRFANRIPLLFEGGSDVISQTALNRINWSAYKINQATDRVGVFVSIVSSKIPFKGAGKEYIADDVEVLRNAVRAAIQSCCAQLKSKLMRQQALREQKMRKRNLAKYIPSVAAAVFTVLSAVADRGGEDGGTDGAGASSRHGRPGKRTRSDPDTSQVLAEVASGQVTEEVLARKLQEHVDRTDLDAALEFQVSQGVVGGAKKDLYLVPRGAAHELGPEMHAPGCVVRVLRVAMWR